MEVEASKGTSRSSGVSQSKAESNRWEVMVVLNRDRNLPENTMSSGYVRVRCQALEAAGSGICDVAEIRETAV